VSGRPLGVAWAPLLKTYTPKKAPKGIRAANPERVAKMEEKNFGKHAAYIRSLPCVVADKAHRSVRTPCEGKVQASHLVTRKMGGCGSDRFSLFPACLRHHEEQEGNTGDFQAAYGFDLAVLVEHYTLADPYGVTAEEKDAARERLRRLHEPR
jgi:hypothetical protein